MAKTDPYVKSLRRRTDELNVRWNEARRTFEALLQQFRNLREQAQQLRHRSS